VTLSRREWIRRKKKREANMKSIFKAVIPERFTQSNTNKPECTTKQKPGREKLYL